MQYISSFLEHVRCLQIQLNKQLVVFDPPLEQDLTSEKVWRGTEGRVKALFDSYKSKGYIDESLPITWMFPQQQSLALDSSTSKRIRSAVNQLLILDRESLPNWKGLAELEVVINFEAPHKARAKTAFVLMSVVEKVLTVKDGVWSVD